MMQLTEPRYGDEAPSNKLGREFGSRLQETITIDGHHRGHLVRSRSTTPYLSEPRRSRAHAAEAITSRFLSFISRKRVIEGVAARNRKRYRDARGNGGNEAHRRWGVYWRKHRWVLANLSALAQSGSASFHGHRCHCRYARSKESKPRRCQGRIGSPLPLFASSRTKQESRCKNGELKVTGGPRRSSHSGSAGLCLVGGR